MNYSHYKLWFILLNGYACIILCSGKYVNSLHPHPLRVRFYPKNSMFNKAELMDRGCKIFVTNCPRVYKQFEICARHYDGEFKTFANFCTMEYENCNSWRKLWSFKWKRPLYRICSTCPKNYCHRNRMEYNKEFKMLNKLISIKRWIAKSVLPVKPVYIDITL